jgi:hypothetical protein
MRRLGPYLALGLTLAAAAGCTSPEATRLRGGGPGADPGNRGAEMVQMHEGADPYWRTPQRIDERLRAPIQTARQADRLSRGQPEPSASPAPPSR